MKSGKREVYGVSRAPMNRMERGAGTNRDFEWGVKSQENWRTVLSHWLIYYISMQPLILRPMRERSHADNAPRYQNNKLPSSVSLRSSDTIQPAGAARYGFGTRCMCSYIPEAVEYSFAALYLCMTECRVFCSFHLNSPLTHYADSIVCQINYVQSVWSQNSDIRVLIFAPLVWSQFHQDYWILELRNLTSQSDVFICLESFINEDRSLIESRAIPNVLQLWILCSPNGTKIISKKPTFIFSMCCSFNVDAESKEPRETPQI